MTSMLENSGETEQNGRRFHHTNHNSMQFKMGIISGTFHLVFLDLG